MISPEETKGIELPSQHYGLRKKTSHSNPFGDISKQSHGHCQKGLGVNKSNNDFRGECRFLKLICQSIIALALINVRSNHITWPIQ